jgi:hypothetical protein
MVRYVSPCSRQLALITFYVNIKLKKVEHFSKVNYSTSFEHPKLSGGEVVPTSQVRASAMFF